MSKRELSFDEKSDLLDQVRTILAFPDVDDDEHIVAEIMELLDVSRGCDPKPLTA